MVLNLITPIVPSNMPIGIIIIPRSVRIGVSKNLIKVVPAIKKVNAVRRYARKVLSLESFVLSIAK